MGLSDAFQSTQKDSACAVRVFRASEARSVGRMCGGAAPDHHGHPPWVCLLLRIMLQGASSEVTKVSTLRLKVFVGDITACMEERTKELAGIAEKVLKSTRREVEEKGLKLSITEGAKEGNEQRHCVLQFFGREISEMQQKRRNGSCNHR